MLSLKIGTVVLMMAGTLAAVSGCGSSDSGTTASSGSTAASGGGANVNFCTKTTAESGNATIKFGGTLGTTYAPACISIKKGSSVTFEGDFAAHPLVGGTIDGSTMVPEKSSPIPMTSTGMTKTVKFPAAGTFGFYCQFHGVIAMMAGEVVVE